MVPIGQAVSEKIFKNIFPIGSYVKTMSVDVSRLGWQTGSSDTMLKGDHQYKNHSIKFGPNRPSSFREAFLNIFPIGSYMYVKTMSVDVGRIGWWVGSSDTILKGDHPRTIPLKFGPNTPSSFREEEF